MDLWLVLLISVSWGGPIGLGIFFMGVGVLWWVSIQDRISKQK